MSLKNQRSLLPPQNIINPEATETRVLPRRGFVVQDMLKVAVSVLADEMNKRLYVVSFDALDEETGKRIYRRAVVHGVLAPNGTMTVVAVGNGNANLISIIDALVRNLRAARGVRDVAAEAEAFRSRATRVAPTGQPRASGEPVAVGDVPEGAIRCEPLAAGDDNCWTV